MYLLSPEFRSSKLVRDFKVIIFSFTAFSCLRLKHFIWNLRPALYVLIILSPAFFKPPYSEWPVSRWDPRNIGHLVYLNAISCLSLHDQCYNESIRKGPGKFMNLWVREHCALSNQMFDAHIWLTPSPLLLSCKIACPVVSLKMSAVPSVALKSRNRVFLR
jgi:hypothetical protein